ncbi:MAG: CapA family protein [Clostridia bacterium]|nr:CapA family protein [Clostridia bacterium]
MKKTTSSILFTGDIGFSRYMKDAWQDQDLIAPELIDFFNSANHVVANVEGALIDPEDAKNALDKGVFLHFMHSGAAKVLENIRADIWCLANNHAMDVGKTGLDSTRKIAKNMNCLTFGAGDNITDASEPIYIDEAGGIGLLAIAFSSECPGATDTECGILTYPRKDIISKRIREIKEKCRWCVVVSHDGEEFTCLPSPYVRQRYLDYLEMGADLVVAHHPHVTMNYEFVGEKAIFYSLGNFIFDTDYQRAQNGTDQGVLLRLDFTPEKFEFVPVGTRINREKTKIEKGELPTIFGEVPEKDYKLLLPLSSKAFVTAEKKRYTYLEPERFQNATEKEWTDFLLSPEREEYVKDEHMDFAIVFPLAEKAKDEKWKESTLEKIKEYILSQI